MIEHGLCLRKKDIDAMLTHVSSQLPLEACGLLAGIKDQVQRVYPIRNAAESPVRFRMDAREQLQAFETAENAGQDILAIYHSHPRGPAMPSPTDIAESMYDVVYLIWSPDENDWQMQGFWIENGHAAQVPVLVLDV